MVGVLVAGALAGFASALAVRRVAHPKTASSLLIAGMIAADLAFAAWAIIEMPHNMLLPVTCLLGWALIALAVIDALVFRLPDFLTLPLVVMGVGVAWLLPNPDVLGHLIGALVGFAVFALIGEIYRRLRGREGLGLGDAKLMAAAGAWLGWQALPSLILMGSVAGLVWVAARYCVRGKETYDERIAFGVPLCAAFWLTWLYGPLLPVAQ
jgi:leader peptidase (prepilin peptidase)/N-methyltransferase